MANFNRALLPLCACFRGELPPRVDWTALLALANQTLTTPSLIACVRSHGAAIPEDVAAYVKELHDRNAIRNDRLNAQLEEAVCALNGAGITPVLVKGAAMLATNRQSDRALRLMSDLDLIVRPEQIRSAMSTLAQIGYRVDHETDGRNKKWYADLKRPLDVGMIDLHNELPGHPFLSQTLEELRLHLRTIRFGAAHALVPSPELEALVLMMHDQLQDFDYWTGRIDLRHLLDLRTLAAAPGGIRWDVLMTMAAGALVRNAVDTQWLLLTTLLNVDWPAHHPKRPMPRLQVWRQLLQARSPHMRYLMLPIGLLDLGSRHRAPARSQAPGQPKRRWFPGLRSVRLLMTLSRECRAGKI